MARISPAGPWSSASSSWTTSIWPAPAWVTNSWFPGDDSVFQVAVQQEHEGIVAKRLDSPYLPGVRARTWLKKKAPDWKRDHAPRRRPRVSA